VSVLEHEALVVHFAVTEYSSYAVCICRPVRNGYRVLHLRLAHVTRGCGFGDDIVGYHTSAVAHVELVGKVVVVRELVAAETKTGPFLAVDFLMSFMVS
jgi:hypothetical protein